MKIFEFIKMFGKVMMVIAVLAIFGLAGTDQAIAYGEYAGENWDVFPYILQWSKLLIASLPLIFFKDILLFVLKILAKIEKFITK